MNGVQRGLGKIKANNDITRLCQPVVGVEVEVDVLVAEVVVVDVGDVEDETDTEDVMNKTAICKSCQICFALV